MAYQQIHEILSDVADIHRQLIATVQHSELEDIDRKHLDSLAKALNLDAQLLADTLTNPLGSEFQQTWIQYSLEPRQRNALKALATERPADSDQLVEQLTEFAAHLAHLFAQLRRQVSTASVGDRLAALQEWFESRAQQQAWQLRQPREGATSANP